MSFRTKLDYSDNRQINQREKTSTDLFGATIFGLPFSGLTGGLDTSLTATTDTYGYPTVTGNTFSGNATTTIFTWYDSRMNLADSSLSAITPSNSGITQNSGSVFTPASSTVIDGNTVNLTYSGVSITNINVTNMEEVSPGNYTGETSVYQFDVLSGGSLDFKERTIWVDNTEITRTDRLIIKSNPIAGYVWTCSDPEGMGHWGPSSAVLSSADTFTTGTTLVGTNLFFDTTAALSAYTANLAPLLDDTNFYTTGTNVVDNTAYFDRNDILSAYTLDLSNIKFSGGAGNCISELYVTDIYGCSPIRVNDELIALSGITFSGTPIEDNTLTQIMGRDAVSGELKYRDVSSIIAASTANTYTTGFTYDDSNNLTIGLNDGSNVSTNIETFSGITTDVINFNLGYTGDTIAEGVMYWDENEQTLSLGLHSGEVSLQLGQEQHYHIKNQSGATIENGRVVRAAGTLGASGRILGEYMIADGTIPPKFTLGVATHDIVNGEEGYVTEFGLVRGVNATGSLYGETWNDGDILYVSPTISGGLTNVEPLSPNLHIEMAIVINSAVNGSIFVRPHRFPFSYDLQDMGWSAGTENHLDVIQWDGNAGYFNLTNAPTFNSISATTISAGTLTTSGITTSGDIIPTIDNTFNIGTPLKRFREVNTVSGTSSYWTSTTVSATTINLGLDSSGNTRTITADNSILKNDCLEGGTY